MAKNEFYAGSKNPKDKRLGAAIVLLAVVILGLASFLTVKFVRERQAKVYNARSRYYCDTVFDGQALGDCTDIRFLADGLLVYTKTGTQAQGLMNLMGEKVTEPLYSAFSVLRNGGWHNVTYTATPLGETYPKTVNIADQTVDVKQYEQGETDTASARWDENINALAWYNEYTGKIAYEELWLSDGLYAVPNSKMSAYGYVNEHLDLVITPQYDNALDFTDGLGAVSENGKWGFVDGEGASATQLRFEGVASLTVEGTDTCFGFCQGLAPVMENGKMGIIDKEGKTVVPFEYDAILPGENGRFVALRNGQWGILSLAGVPEGETVSHTDPDAVGTAGKGEYKVTTAGSSLNLRASNSSVGALVAKIPNGTKLTVTQIADGWAFVTYNGQTGWVSADYLTPVETVAEP